MLQADTLVFMQSTEVSYLGLHSRELKGKDAAWVAFEWAYSVTEKTSEVSPPSSPLQFPAITFYPQGKEVTQMFLEIDKTGN